MRRYIGLDVLAKSRLHPTSTDTDPAAEVNLPALTA